MTACTSCGRASDPASRIGLDRGDALVGRGDGDVRLEEVDRSPSQLASSSMGRESGGRPHPYGQTTGGLAPAVRGGRAVRTGQRVLVGDRILRIERITT